MALHSRQWDGVPVYRNTSCAHTLLLKLEIQLSLSDLGRQEAIYLGPQTSQQPGSGVGLHEVTHAQGFRACLILIAKVSECDGVTSGAKSRGRFGGHTIPGVKEQAG